MENFDVAVIGLGPAGLKFAQLALAKGLKVVCFEKKHAGGTCLNVGCIPTKSILHDASTHASWEEAKARAEKITKTFRSAVEKSLVASGAEIVFQEAKIIDRNTVLASGAEYKADKIICATGSHQAQIKGLECDGEFLLSSDDIFKLDSVPNNILIIGSGAIGIEWARIFSDLGSSVTVVEKAPNLLPALDISVSKRMERILRARKIKFYTSCGVENVENKKVTLENGETLEPSKVLVAIGRVPVCPKLPDGVYAIGDAKPVLMLAHSAEAQAVSLFNHLYNGKELIEISSADIPSVIYGVPEIASIGVREQDIENLEDYKIYNYPLLKLAKAHCDNQIEGFIKIITTLDGEIKGAHIVSLEASSLVSQIQIAMKGKLKVDDIKEIIFAHPTLSEGIKEALFE
ncbi:NAD(P)/FAD-dependent oxidoreductase [bacterium]|nr:NAD(P)/FAD-dependent oxidoreductase [bacterium]